MRHPPIRTIPLPIHVHILCRLRPPGSAFDHRPACRTKKAIQMAFVKYDKGVKVIVVSLRQRGYSLEEINETLELKISSDGWTFIVEREMWSATQPCMRNEGVLLRSQEKRPNLSSLRSTTIRRSELRIRLNLTNKIARTVHPAQSEDQRAKYINEIGPFPLSYFVFVDECAVSPRSHSCNYARSH
ncbi:hypothetical protein PCANC_21378 [Puccinia coronata f. sp. avenae]|uniref:Uncharacterized protein n=1 Tax=Puccinia coronata f. sp. avenae TaxID=200324 RepID=A0A2N5S9E7_9BASI|nr:hypothetical protein PCANC_21378 [Puccinia coronata f. sp. avenae]